MNYILSSSHKLNVLGEKHLVLVVIQTVADAEMFPGSDSCPPDVSLPSGGDASDLQLLYTEWLISHQIQQENFYLRHFW